MRCKIGDIDHYDLMVYPKLEGEVADEPCFGSEEELDD